MTIKNETEIPLDDTIDRLCNELQTIEDRYGNRDPRFRNKLQEIVDALEAEQKFRESQN